MPPITLYHYSKTRAQHSRIFLNMALCCWLYIGGIYAYAYWGEGLAEDTQVILVTAFAVSSAILFYIVWWLRAHPARYEAYITPERFVVHYPGSKRWSFDVDLNDIKKFEHRNNLSHAGKGIGSTGIVLKNGTFHPISTNYGNNINAMHKAISQVKPAVRFSHKVNLKVEGFLAKDHDDRD